MNTFHSPNADDYPDQLPERLPQHFCVALWFSVCLAVFLTGSLLW